MLLSGLLGSFVTSGTVTLVEADGKAHVIRGAAPGPSVTLRLHDRVLPWHLLVNPKLRFGEAYMDGRLTIEQGTLREVMDIMCRGLASIEETPAYARRTRMVRWARHILSYNPINLSRRNVAHHYDLSGALYDLFLDKDRQYSCAYFTSDNQSLEIAQENKKLHLASKLLVGPGQRVLDIGSGWGGLALYLNELCGADVTGITLSTEQHKVAEERARKAGVADQVRFHLRDYRDEEGQYDRIVSVGMFEHVGVPHYRAFFAKAKKLLAEDGVMLLHSIGRMEPPSVTGPWVRKYIFPGGYVPAMSEVLKAVEDVGLWVTDIEILRLHYAKTLHEWHRRFAANRDKIKQIYDERFCRMWEFYLVGSEMSFRHLKQMVFQMQLTRRNDAAPLTRDYMIEFERTHRGRETAAA
jgi:cyclopropane-fatty-acyl-phospholipid synthase